MARLVEGVMEGQQEVQVDEGREEEENVRIDSLEGEGEERANATSDEADLSSPPLPLSHLPLPARRRTKAISSFSSSSSSESRLSSRRRRGLSTDLNRKKKVSVSRSSFIIKIGSTVLLMTLVLLLLSKVFLSRLRACLSSSGGHTPHLLPTSSVSSPSHHHSYTATSPAHRRLSSSFSSFSQFSKRNEDNRLLLSSIVNDRTTTTTRRRMPSLRRQSPEKLLSPSSLPRRLSSSSHRSATFPSLGSSLPGTSSSAFSFLSSPSACIEIGPVIDEEEGIEDEEEDRDLQHPASSSSGTGSLISTLKRKISLSARAIRSFAFRTLLSIALVAGVYIASFASQQDSQLYRLLSSALISVSALGMIVSALQSLRGFDWIKTLRGKREQDNKKRKTSSRTSVSRLTEKWRTYYHKLIAEYTASSSNDSAFDDQGHLLSPEKDDQDHDDLEVLADVFDRLQIRVSPHSESEEGLKDARVKEEIEQDEEEERRKARKSFDDEVFSVLTADTEGDGDGRMSPGPLLEIV